MVLLVVVLAVWLCSAVVSLLLDTTAVGVAVGELIVVFSCLWIYAS